MKKIKSFILSAKYYVLTAAVLMAGGIPAMAAKSDSMGRELLTETNDALGNILEDLATLLQTIMGLGGLVVLVTVIFKVFKGDREAAEKLAWWAAGLVIGFVLITVVKNLIK